MIKKLEITGVHSVVSEDLSKYARNKIGKLDRFIPRHARESAHAEVFLKEFKAKNKKQCMCEVVIHLPQETITTKESTLNMFAAIDIVEAKLKNQLKKYKDQHSIKGIHRRVINKFRRTTTE